eukprot:TRINITY_DN2589_c0_g1_i5.p1 TRINITY_DN2589_c0_g1~~TRINITY_DN2589_c0_g1_i5.p1  ORF type:complete len:175 (+),score=0.87 TRINITY_DN2589_c0_g1_i5:261-785(+)
MLEFSDPPYCGVVFWYGAGVLYFGDTMASTDSGFNKTRFLTAEITPSKSPFFDTAPNTVRTQNQISSPILFSPILLLHSPFLPIISQSLLILVCVARIPPPLPIPPNPNPLPLSLQPCPSDRVLSCRNSRKRQARTRMTAHPKRTKKPSCPLCRGQTFAKECRTSPILSQQAIW